MAKRDAIKNMALQLEKLTATVQESLKHTEAIKNRLARIEYGVYEVQKDLIALDEEIRGIHRVIDSVNVRVFALEMRAGMSPLFPSD
jgi:archaellum component FlaC